MFEYTSQRPSSATRFVRQCSAYHLFAGGLALGVAVYTSPAK